MTASVANDSTDTTGPLLSLQAVSKAYRVGPVNVNVLRGIDLDVQHGDLISVMGPSGCGKSTLMNILGLLDRPTSGTYRLDGRTVADMDDDEQSRIRNAKIGFVFQSFNLLPRLTARENVALPLVYRGEEGPSVAERCQEVLDKVGMSERADHKPNELSGGQQQRVSIARALIGRPSLLLADEPTGALDSENGRQTMRTLKQLNQEDGVTVVIITHDLAVARQCDRRTNLSDGVLTE